MDMAAYMRDRRAKMRAQGLNSRGKPLKTNAAKVVTSKPAMPVIDAALPRDTILKAGPAELATVRAKLAAARGWVITKTSGQLDVIGREAFEARHASTKEMMTAAKPPAPPPALRSMFACGGTAGKGLVPMGRGYPAAPDIAARQFDRYETMLGALAQRADDQGRQIAEQDRRIARLEERDGDAVG